MIREFCLPDVGEGISEAEIVRWLIAEGSTVNEDQDIGEILVTIETGEAGQSETRAPQTDRGTVVGSLGDEEMIELPTPVKAIPAVRALAKKLGVDLTKIHGTGSEGKITREDV